MDYMPEYYASIMKLRAKHELMKIKLEDILVKNTTTQQPTNTSQETAASTTSLDTAASKTSPSHILQNTES